MPTNRNQCGMWYFTVKTHSSYCCSVNKPKTLKSYLYLTFLQMGLCEEKLYSLTFLNDIVPLNTITLKISTDAIWMFKHTAKGQCQEVQQENIAKKYKDF